MLEIKKIYIFFFILAVEGAVELEIVCQAQLIELVNYGTWGLAIRALSWNYKG